MDDFLHDVHAFAERRHLRAAKLIDLAATQFAIDGSGDGFGHIADIDRLKLRMAAADRRQEGRDFRHGGEPVEEIILRAEHDGRAEDDRVADGFERRCLARRLRAAVLRRRIGIGADGADMDEPGALGAGRLCNGAGTKVLNRSHVVAAAGVEGAGQVDHRIGAQHGPVDRPADAYIGLDRLDLAEVAKRLEMLGKVGSAAGHQNAVAALGKRPHDMAAKKAGAAENCNALGKVFHGHCLAERKRCGSYQRPASPWHGTGERPASS